MKNHRFLWLRNRTTDNRKCEKARNIKEKRTIEMFSTVSRKQEEQASSRRDSSTCPCDCSEWSRAMECAPSYVAGALLRGDQRRRTAEDNGNLEISGFLTDWIVMKIADFRFVTNTLLTCY